MQNVEITGAGGVFGDSASSDDSEQFAGTSLSMVFSINAGVIGGAVDWPKSIYINDTVLENSDGERNFSSVSYDVRLGDPSQTPLDGYDTQENPIDVSASVVVGVPVTRTLTTANATRAQVTLIAGPFFDQQDGVMKAASASFNIQVAAAGGDFITVKSDSIKLLNTSGYPIDYEFDLIGSAPWQVRVTKTGTEYNSTKHKNALTFSRVTEIEQQTLSHDGVALLKLNFSADEIGSQPQVGVKCKLQEIPIPTNYNQATGEYDGAWDLGFIAGHTSNPVWLILYLLRSDQDGLGLTSSINLAAFYETAKYCDEWIDNGVGGLRKRYTFNGQLLTLKDAWKHLQEVASVFHGRVIDDNQQITLTDDRPRDTKILVTTANVINGEFITETTSRAGIVTTVRVSWNDPDLNGKKVVETVEDAALVAKHGYNVKQIHRLACTDRQEAIAHAKWMLEHQKHNYTISYQAALDHMVADGTGVIPGDVVAICDAEYSGRLLNVGEALVTLDRNVTIEIGKSYEIWITGSDGVVTKNAFNLDAGEYSQIGVMVDAVEGAVFEIICDANAQNMRVLSISENDGILDIVTIPYDGELTIRAELPTSLDDKVYEQLASGRVGDLSNLDFIEVVDFIDGIEAISGGTLSVEIPSDVGIKNIEFQQRLTGENWQVVGFSSLGSIEIRNLKIGSVYEFRARAKGRFTIDSEWIELLNVAPVGRPDLPDAPSDFVAVGAVISAILNWTNPSHKDFKEVVIYISTNGNFANAVEYARTTDNWANIGNLTGEQSYTFWLRTVVRGEGAFVQSLLTAPKQVLVLKLGVDDITNDLIDPLKDSIAANVSSSIAYMLSNKENVDNISIEKSLSVSRFGDAEAKIETVKTTQAGIVSAAIADLLGLQANKAVIAQNIGHMGVNLTTQKAAITEVERVAADEKIAVAQSIQNIEAEADNTNADITTFKQTVATDQSATATALQTVEASIGDNSQQIADVTVFAQAVADEVLGLSAEYVVTVDAGGVITGFHLRSNGAGLSEFVIQANNFLVVSSDGNKQLFAVDVDGKAFMDSAIIKELTIDKLTGGELGADMQIGIDGSISIGNEFTMDKDGIRIG